MTPTITIATKSLTTPANYIREDDLRAHIEDDLIVTVRRNGQRVQVRWNDLTPAEQTQHCPRNSKGYLLPPRIATPAVNKSWLPMR